MACPTRPGALRAHTPYVLYVPYVPYMRTCPNIFYRQENWKMEILYPHVFKGTKFNFGT